MGIGLGQGAAPSRRLLSGEPRAGQLRVPSRGARVWLVPLLGLTACEAEESEPTEEETPPLKEPHSGDT